MPLWQCLASRQRVEELRHGAAVLEEHGPGSQEHHDVLMMYLCAK